MKSVAIKAFSRTESGRTGVKKVRANGRIPAVIYGRKIQPQNLEVDAKELDDLISHSVGEHFVVDLTIDQETGSGRLALLQEVQHNPLSGKVVHVDFHEVDATEAVEVSVPLETIGEAAGVKLGGMLEHVAHKVLVKALPRDLPEAIIVDVSELGLGQALHLKDITPPKGVEILGDGEIVVATVAEPKAAAAEETPAAATATEPEMIKEKKVDDAKK